MVLFNDFFLGMWVIIVKYNDSKEYSNIFFVEEYGNIIILRGFEGCVSFKLF